MVSELKHQAWELNSTRSKKVEVVDNVNTNSEWKTTQWAILISDLNVYVVYVFRHGFYKIIKKGWYKVEIIMLLDIVIDNDSVIWLLGEVLRFYCKVENHVI